MKDKFYDTCSSLRTYAEVVSMQALTCMMTSVFSVI